MRKFVALAFLLLGAGHLAQADPLYTYTYVGQPYTIGPLGFGHMTATIVLTEQLPYNGSFVGALYSWQLGDNVARYSSLDTPASEFASVELGSSNGIIFGLMIVCEGPTAICVHTLTVGGSSGGGDSDYQFSLAQASNTIPGVWSGETAPPVPEPFSASCTALGLGIAALFHKRFKRNSPERAAKSPRERFRCENSKAAKNARVTVTI